jgi:hypothetical protein
MKRRYGLIAALLCLPLMAAGCSSSSEEPKEVVTTDAADTSGEAEEAEETAAAEETEAEETEENAAAEAEDSGVVTIEEQVLVDQDGIKITATEYVTDGFMGDGIKLLVENNTDQDYSIGCDALIVNDYMITDLFACDVAGGKKANEVMYLSSTALKAAGITNVGKIEMYFHAYDSDWENLFSKVYSEIQTSAYDSMDTTPDDTGLELYNENGIRIVGKTVDENSFWGTAILLYCENTSGQNVGINVENMSINGFMMTPYYSADVYDGKKSIDEITILSSELEDNGIESIEEVELKFHLYDLDTYETIADSDAITFSAK